MHRAIQHEMLQFTTAGRRDVVDLTDDLELLIMKHRMVAGRISVKATHTTARVVGEKPTDDPTARVIEQENEPQMHLDLFERLDSIASPDGEYRHDKIGTLRTINVCDGECQNGWAHIQASFFPNEVTIHVANGERVKGRWDRVLLFEFDDARERTISVIMDGEFEDMGTPAESTAKHPAISHVHVG